MKRRNMCPSPDCAKGGEPTGLMGGCDCGTPLVPYDATPTDEQLQNVMVVFGIPVQMALTMTLTPALRSGAIYFHSLVQRALDGDDEAYERIDFLVAKANAIAAI